MNVVIFMDIVVFVNIIILFLFSFPLLTYHYFYIFIAMYIVADGVYHPNLHFAQIRKIYRDIYTCLMSIWGILHF